MKITADYIIGISIKILNEKGVKKLSIREISKKLKIKSSSLYWHIKNKEEIYNKISEKIYNEIDINISEKNHRKYLYELYVRYRIELLKIRDSIEIIRRSDNMPAINKEFIELTAGCIKNMGVKEKYCLMLAAMMNNYVLSFVENEQKLNKKNEESFNYILEVIIKGIQTS